MIAITHLVVSVLLIQLLSLDRNDSFVALMFGVFIDFDHLLGLNDYIRTNGFSGLFDMESIMHPEGQWKSLFHNPIAVMVVGPVSIGSRMAIPLLFWGTHLAMDYVQETFLGLFSLVEMAILAGATVTLLVLRYRQHRALHDDLAVLRYLRIEMSGLSRSFGRLVRSVVPRRSL
jgi:hypothetical protein